MNPEESLKKINEIYLLINASKFQEALSKLNELLKKYPNDSTIQFNKVCCYIDIGSGLKDIKLIHKGIKIGESYLESEIDKRHLPQLYYKVNSSSKCNFNI